MLSENQSSDRALAVFHLLDQLAASLRCLGDTAGEVHWTLLYEGVRGVRCAASFANPVVRYLLRRRDGSGKLEIPLHGNEVILCLDGREHRLPLPQAAIDFLERFHAGFYPAIEASQ